MLKNKKGFTLVELIIVIVIIAILVAIAIPAVARFVDNANRARSVANARTLYMAASVHAADLASRNAIPASTTITVDNSTLPAPTDPPVALTGDVGSIVSYAGFRPSAATVFSIIINDDGTVGTFSYQEGRWTTSLGADGILTTTP